MFEIMSIKGSLPIFMSGGHKQIKRSFLVNCYSNGEFEIGVDENWSNINIDIRNFYFSNSDFAYFEKIGENGLYYYDDGKSLFTRGDNILIEEIGFFLPFREVVFTDFPIAILAIDGNEQIQEVGRFELVPNEFIKIGLFLENLKNRPRFFKLYGFIYASIDYDVDLYNIDLNRTVGGFFIGGANEYLQYNLLEVRFVMKLRHNKELEYDDIKEVVL